MTTVFRHGALRLYLLKLLGEHPRHGYEIISLLEDRFLGFYAPSAGTVYPRLAKLEAEGLVEHEETDGRKVYSLTTAGREELARQSEELRTLESDLSASVAELAKDVRTQVRASVRDLRDELKQAAREVRREARAAGRIDGDSASASVQILVDEIQIIRRDLARAALHASSDAVESARLILKQAKEDALAVLRGDSPG